MQFTDEQKDALKRNLLEITASALESNKIAEEDVPEIARYILDHMENVTTDDDVNMFLSQVSSFWPIFSSLALESHEKEDDKKENQAVENAENLIKQGKLDEALNVTKEATE